MMGPIFKDLQTKTIMIVRMNGKTTKYKTIIATKITFYNKGYLAPRPRLFWRISRWVPLLLISQDCREN